MREVNFTVILQQSMVASCPIPRVSQHNGNACDLHSEVLGSNRGQKPVKIPHFLHRNAVTVPEHVTTASFHIPTDW